MLFLKNFDSFRLDTIGFLAILGEGSVQANYQVSTLSKFTFLPRLLPAPQAFIRPSRPRRLETASGTAAGTYSGNLQLSVNRIAHVLLAGHILLKHERSAYSVQCVRIRGADEEVNEEERDKERNERPTVPLLKPKTWGPLPLLSTLGLAMSVTLLILSIVREDGWALLATLLLSFLSTLIGFGSYWQLNLAVRKSKRNVPPADVVVIYPGGVFVVVKCNENVARALFFAPETCQYFMDQGNYQRLALVATMMLMFGVIALGNATLPLQISFGASYLLLNAGYWYVASLGEECHWDLTSFNVTPELFKATPAKATPVKATPKSPNVASEQTHVEATSYVEEGTFTRALWKAIAITGTASWVRLGQVAPVTDAWNKWLKEAEDVLEPTWSGGMEPPRDNGAIVIPYWHCDDSLTSFIKARGFTTRRPSVLG
ncbi:MAG: hypothetical protein M1839_009505 [Geoglossum umbratile]|nr:MAG: hypothetical protein M1839_009505 [Geoglossum umbratile]